MARVVVPTVLRAEVVQIIVVHKLQDVVVLHVCGGDSALGTRACVEALPERSSSTGAGGGGPPSAVAATPLTSRRDPSRPTSLTPSTCRVALSARSLERRLLGMSALLPLARWRPTMSMRACVTFPIMASLIMMVVVWLMASRVDPHGSVGNLLTATRVLNVRFNPLCEQFFIGDRFEKLVDYCVLIAHLRLDVGAS